MTREQELYVRARAGDFIGEMHDLMGKVRGINRALGLRETDRHHLQMLANAINDVLADAPTAREKAA